MDSSPTWRGNDAFIVQAGHEGRPGLSRESGFVMTKLVFRPLGIGTVALLMFAGNALAQTASPILNTLEVQKLIASKAPGDNAALAAHFSALADRYAAEAKRHTAMAGAFIAAPTRRVPANHCKRLAQLNTDSARTLRELAAHHEKLAGGVASTAPKGAAGFQGGKGAPEPTDADLSALAARANTPTDHHALEEYFVTASKRYTADANAHVAMAQAYRGSRIVQAADHCDRLARQLRDSAKEATDAAAMHKQLAGIAR
jgi:hypothetical protein